LKGLYLTFVDIYDSNNSGYIEKIFGQVNSFLKFSEEIVVFSISYKNTSITYEKRKKGSFLPHFKSIKKYKNRLLLFLFRFEEVLKEIIQFRPEFVYIRYDRSDMIFLNFLRSIKRINPSTIVIIEIPTYPYDKEYRGFERGLVSFTITILDKFFRHFLRSYVDRIAVVDYEGPVFGIPSISFDNGIDISNIPFHEKIKKSSDSITIICVSHLNYWHGYDRLIKGMGIYYKNKASGEPEILLQIIGDGVEINNLKSISLFEEIGDKVTFLGLVPRENLEIFYRSADIAVGSLGIHRIGIIIASPLKNREYCARGTPFIFSFEDPDFPNGFPFVLSVFPSDEPIDIFRVIKWYYEMIKNPDYRMELRNYAEKNLSWETKMKPVLDYICGDVAKRTE
jgi:hypothetical protein